MKTKKSVWSIVLSLILVLALALSIGLGIQKSTVNAQDDEHITFNVLVDDEAYKSVSSTYSGQFTVSYYVTESTGVDALQLKLGYDHEKFTLVSVVTNDETALGAATNGVEDYLDNVVYDNTNKNGAVLVLNSEGESILLITAVFEVKEGATLVKGAEYEFGFYNVNDTEEEDTYSTAWRIEKDAENPENPSTHEKVEILFANIAKIITKASIRPILTGIVRNYNGQYAQNSEITINLANAYQNFSEIEQYDLIPEEICPGIDEIAWFEAYETEYNNYVRYRKLSGTPKDAGTYYVAIRTSANDYFEAYCGWALEDQELFGEGAYGLDAWAVGNWSGVATYVINPLAITITMDNQTSAYGDAIVSPLTYTQTGTIVEGENLHFIPSTTATSESDVGTYPITMGHDNNSNYNVTVNTGVYTITQKAITITALPQSAKYTGSEPTVDQSKYTVSGVDSISGVVITKASGVTVGTYTLTPSYTNTNYNITLVNGTFTITLNDLTQEQVDALVAEFAKFYAVDNGTQVELEIENQEGSYNKTYDALSAYIGVVVENNEKIAQTVQYKVGDSSYSSVEAVLENFAQYAQTNAGDYVVKITFTPGTGYAFAQGVDAEYEITLTIARKALTITASGNVQYGDILPAITIDNGTGWVGSENYATYHTNVQALEEEYVDSNYNAGMTAGTHYAVTWDSEAKDEIEDILTNYDVTLVGADCVVAKKVLNAADYAFAGYTGQYDAANHTLAVTGDLDLVNVTISSEATVKATVKNVADSGNYTATIALKDATNYTFENGTNTGWTVAEGYASANKEAAVSITPKALAINIDYTKTTATFTLSGFAGEETEAVLTNLAYTANQSQSYCINGNVFTVDNEVYDIVTISATSENTNYTITPNQLRKIIIVGYLAGPYDVNISGETPVRPSNDVFFAGFKTVEPEPVELNHYTFKCFSTDSAGNNPFNYDNAVNESTPIYVTWTLNDKYTITLYYMVEGDAENLHQVGEVLSFYDDVAIRYNNELPAMQANAWFRTQEWYTNTELTTKFVSGSKLSGNITLYANYVFNIGLGDVNGNGLVNANDITLYREYIVGGYEMTEVEVGEEWETVTAQEFDAQNVYFIKRVADSNAQSVESTVLGDNSLDIRDVSTIRMAMVGGYGFAIVEGKTVDGEALLISRMVSIENMSNLLAVARSGKAVQLADDIEEENFVGAIANCQNDVVIDLNNHEITVKSLSISLAANNTGKIEIKNGRINVADGNGVHLSAPAGSIILDDVTLYDRDGIFELQAANESLHFNNVVKFLKDEQGEEAPAAVKVENGTHVVVEQNAVVTVEKLVVTESFVPAQESSDAKITINVESVEPQEIVVDGFVEVEEGAEEIVKPTYLEVATNAEFIAAAHQTDIKVIKLTEDLVDLGTVTFVGNVTIEGNGHVISGNSALRLNKAGAKVSNVKFQNIHNSTSQLTPVYGTKLEGKLEIENCEFNTVDWDAIQIEPVAGAEVVIKNNIFRHSGENAVNTRRYVHIQSATNVDFAAAIENNKFYNVEYLRDTAIEVYYPTNESKVVILNNYVDAPVGVCILKNSGANAWYLANSFVEEDLETAVVMKAAIVETYNVYFFRTLQEAVDFAGQNQTTITLIDDASGDGVVVAENQNITFDFNGYTYTVNGTLVGSTGTKTLGFQLLKGANVTFKNGTLKTVNAKMLIQNYANTTLDNFTVSGEGATQLQYVTSNNFGSMTVKAGSKILAYNNQVAFDLWYGMNPVYDDGVTVTLKAGSEVVGKVEYGAASRKASEDFSDKAVLNVEDGAVWDKVITLVSNIYVDHQIVIDKDLTLNLNGKTVKYIGETMLTSGLFGVKRGATLTINDTIGTGKIDASSDKIYAAVILTINSAEGATGEKAKVVVNGGTLEGYYYAITGNGSRHNTEIIVNNGTLYGMNGTAIYNPQDGLVTINNGHFKGLETAVEIRAGELVINDGVFEALSEEFSIEGNGSGTTMKGIIIAVSQHSTQKNITVTINGGTFTNGICALAMGDTVSGNVHNDKMNVEINDGTFNTIEHAQNKTIHVNNGNLVINGGNFNCAPDSDGLGSTTVFAENYGYVTINGGTFKSSAKYANRYWILNVRNNAKDTAKMLVRGGTFYEFDPSNPNTDDSVSYVELGYSAEENDGVYTVVYVGINIGGQDPVNPPVDNPALPF